MQQCPSCSYELTMTEQIDSPDKCPKCGIYFAKFRAKAQAEAQPFQAVKPTTPDRPSESSFRLTADPVKVATRGLQGVQPVVVVDVHMRFWSMVVFMVKASLAAIPAIIILVMLFAVISAFMGGLLFSGMANAQAQQGCMNFSSSQIRTMQIKKEIAVCMTGAQLERVWGKPTKVRKNHPGDDEWEYWNPSGDQVVTFGPQGCVTGWYTHRD